MNSEEVEIDPPGVTLESFYTMRGKEHVLYEENEYEEEEAEVKRANVLRMFGEKVKDRATKVFQQLNPDTLRNLSKEEIEFMKNLMRERPQVFGLPGEELKATHSIVTTTGAASQQSEQDSVIALRSMGTCNDKISKQE